MPRPNVVAFRLTPDETQRLAAAAQAAGLTLAAWSRLQVLDRLAAGSAAPAAAPGAEPRPALQPPPAVVPAATPYADAAPAAAAPEPLTRVAAAKLTASQHFDLDVRAKAAGVPVGTYLRRLIQGQPPSGRWPLARKAIVELARVGNNLNQLVKLAHEGLPLPADLSQTVASVLAAVRDLRRALMEEPGA